MRKLQISAQHWLRCSNLCRAASRSNFNWKVSSVSAMGNAEICTHIKCSCDKYTFPSIAGSLHFQPLMIWALLTRVQLQSNFHAKSELCWTYYAANIMLGLQTRIPHFKLTLIKSVKSCGSDEGIFHKVVTHSKLEKQTLQILTQRWWFKLEIGNS